MGSTKEQYLEKLEQQENENIAKLLGITYEELLASTYQVMYDDLKDGIFYKKVLYFEDSTPQEILNKIQGLDKYYRVWLNPHDSVSLYKYDSPKEYSDEDYSLFAEQFEAIISNKSYYDSFQQEIINVKHLNELILDDQSLQYVLRGQLYITSIGALETFLSETFINLTNENNEYFKNFIKSYPEFKKSKFQLNEIYEKYETLKKTAEIEMMNVIYHNLEKVKNMYTSTFKIEFPDIVELLKAISIRHDLVHRNGKTKEGKKVLILKETVTDLLDKISNFVESIANSLNLRDENKFKDISNVINRPRP